MPSSSLQPAVCDVVNAPVAHAALPQAAVTALWRGQVVEAMKLVRAEQNISLKEAKELVTAYIQMQPALRNQIDQTEAATREGLVRWLIFLLVGGVGLTYLLL